MALRYSEKLHPANPILTLGSAILTLGSDPFGFDVVTNDKETGQKVIQSKDGTVELHVEETQSLGRSRFKSVVVLNFPNDYTETTYSSKAKACKAFVLEIARSRLESVNLC